MTERVNPASAEWVTSSSSGAQGNCLEMSGDFPGVVPVRDSEDTGGAVLWFGARQWAAFVAAVRGAAGR